VSIIGLRVSESPLRLSQHALAARATPSDGDGIACR